MNMKPMKLMHWLAIGSFALATSLSHAGTTYAVCVGINDYPEAKNDKGEVEDNDLRGCVNDAKSMAALFSDKFSVDKANVRLLLEKDANADKLIDSIRWALLSAKAGDQVVFTYSGHGGQIEDKTEEDGLEEVIVLSDGKLVTGDFFNEVAKTFAANGINATFVFDSCFSGGMSRDAGGKVKTRTKSLGVLKKGTMAKGTDGLAKMSLKKRSAQQPKGEYAFLFAGQEDKPTIDIEIEDIPAHGLFTMLFLDIVNEDPKMGITAMYELLNGQLDELNKALKAKDKNAPTFDQKPTCEASSADRAKKPLLLGG